MSQLNVEEIVKLQSNAMRSETFEIGVLRISPDRRGVMRVWDKTTLIKSVTWLKRENTKGMNIHIRPTGNHLTLLDDLCTEQLSTISDQGFDPCVILETSPHNFQVCSITGTIWHSRTQRTQHNIWPSDSAQIMELPEEDTSADSPDSRTGRRSIKSQVGSSLLCASNTRR